MLHLGGFLNSFNYRAWAATSEFRRKLTFLMQDPKKEDGLYCTVPVSIRS